MDRLEPVADIRQRAADDDPHRVVEVAALHLGLDVDRLDPVVTGGLVRFSHPVALRCDHVVGADVTVARS